MDRILFAEGIATPVVEVAMVLTLPDDGAHEIGAPPEDDEAPSAWAAAPWTTLPPLRGRNLSLQLCAHCRANVPGRTLPPSGWGGLLSSCGAIRGRNAAMGKCLLLGKQSPN